MRDYSGDTDLLPPRLDIHHLVAIDDPSPVYGRLRSAGPLARAGLGTWAVTRYADVSALLRDRRLGSEFSGEYWRASAGVGVVSDFFHNIILYRDPPTHTRLRRLIGSAFTPPAIRCLAGKIRDMVDTLLDPVAERGAMDAIPDLAFPLPVMVIAELMGIPLEDRGLIGPWAIELGQAFVPMVPATARQAAAGAVVRLRDYFGSLLAERRRQPGDDLLTTLLNAEAGDHRLSHTEIVDNAIFTLFAGFETSVNLIGTGCALLLGHPHVLERLQRDPALVPGALEEFMRFDAPIQGVGRLVLEPISLGGRVLRAGRVVLLLIGSANHDETVFAAPERLDVMRSPNPHLSFGAGPHACLGAQLARLEGTIVFTRLLERFTLFEPAGEPIRRADTTLRGYASVPMLVKPASHI